MPSLLGGQASFDPPGLSVAVKKDRAAEPLLTSGAKFVVNILAEGEEKPVIRQLLKSFKPGEDRFAGLDIKVRSHHLSFAMELLFPDIDFVRICLGIISME